MGIKIGNNNTIKNSNIAEKINGNPTQDSNKRTFFERHPAICSFLISLVAGIVLLFSGWEKIISWIEGWL